MCQIVNVCVTYVYVPTSKSWKKPLYSSNQFFRGPRPTPSGIDPRECISGSKASAFSQCKAPPSPLATAEYLASTIKGCECLLANSHLKRIMWQIVICKRKHLETNFLFGVKFLTLSGMSPIVTKGQPPPLPMESVDKSLSNGAKWYMPLGGWSPNFLTCTCKGSMSFIEIPTSGDFLQILKLILFAW